MQARAPSSSSPAISVGRISIRPVSQNCRLPTSSCTDLSIGDSSRWAWVLMKPGVTIRSGRSTVRSTGSSYDGPTWTIRSPSTTRQPSRRIRCSPSWWATIHPARYRVVATGSVLPPHRPELGTVREPDRLAQLDPQALVQGNVLLLAALEVRRPPDLVEPVPQQRRPDALAAADRADAGEVPELVARPGAVHHALDGDAATQVTAEGSGVEGDRRELSPRRHAVPRRVPERRTHRLAAEESEGGAAGRVVRPACVRSEERRQGPVPRDQPASHRVVVEGLGHHPDDVAPVGRGGRPDLEHGASLGHRWIESPDLVPNPWGVVQCRTSGASCRSCSPPWR